MPSTSPAPIPTDGSFMPAARAISLREGIRLLVAGLGDEPAGTPPRDEGFRAALHDCFRGQAYWTGTVPFCAPPDWRDGYQAGVLWFGRLLEAERDAHGDAQDGAGGSAAGRKGGGARPSARQRRSRDRAGARRIRRRRRRARG